MERLSILFSLLLIVHLGTAQGVWDGGAGTTKWNDKGNWDDDTVPSLTTNVLIDGAFTVELDMDGFCASLELRGESSFTIGGLATLKIDQNTLTGFHIKVNNKTTLTNTGFIDLKNPASTSIINAGTFNNLALIKIKESGISIHNESDGLFINDGDLQIVRTKVGILNEGDFQNKDEVLLDSVDLSASGLGIQNFSIFSNSSSGQIVITSTGNNHPGIKIESNGTLTNNGLIEIVQSPYGIIVWGELVNNDSISIKDTDMSPLINNRGTITNSASGTINILKNTTVDNPGIRNWANSTIHNDGTISVDSIMGHGLLNLGTCHINGTLKIQNCEDDLIVNGDSLNIGNSGYLNLTNTLNITNIHGFMNADTGVTLNEGIIRIDSIDQDGISNNGIFTNQDSIFIEYARTGFRNRGTFTNDAYCKASNNVYTSFFNNGSFINTGNLALEPIIGEYGLENQDTISNLGTIIIKDSKEFLINNTSSGFFENDGIINGKNGITGLENTAIFINKGQMTMDSMSDQGIENYNKFYNEDGSVLTLCTTKVGIRIEPSSMMTNDGTINIYNIDDGVRVSGVFINSQILDVYGFSDIGFEIRTSGSLENGENSMLKISDGVNGILSNHSIENKGQIMLNIMSEYGMKLESGDFDQKVTGSLFMYGISGNHLEVSNGVEVSILGEFLTTEQINSWN